MFLKEFFAPGGASERSVQCMHSLSFAHPVASDPNQPRAWEVWDLDMDLDLGGDPA